METITAEQFLVGLLISIFVIPCIGAYLIFYFTNRVIDKKINIIKNLKENIDDDN